MELEHVCGIETVEQFCFKLLRCCFVLLWPADGAEATRGASENENDTINSFKLTQKYCKKRTVNILKSQSILSVSQLISRTTLKYIFKKSSSKVM